MTITFITGNAGKFKEAQAILSGLVQLDVDLPEIQSLDPHEVIRAKLEEARKHGVAGAIVVEDTSLYIDALGGLPGPLIKWFLERLKAEGIAELVENLGKGNTAEARCVVGYLAEGALESQFFEGSMRGSIVAPRGAGGFGWDVIFQPEGSNKTLGELSFEEKNTISIRAQAFANLHQSIISPPIY
jgi:non-canonical purine NTP pyrophosphatase (RdgB/HAM1 family)